MDENLLSNASVSIRASVNKVWDALVTPATIKQYRVGSKVTSDWTVGGPIHWKGDYQGKKYEDKGVILQLVPRQTLLYSHFSPLSGKADAPENYHTITFTLTGLGVETTLELSQDNNPTPEARDHTAKFWQGMLETLKKLLET